MQYNPVFNQQTNNSHSTHSTGNAFKPNPPQTAATKPPGNNIFSRNVISTPINPSPSTNPNSSPSSHSNPFSKSSNSPTTNVFTSNIKTGNSMASNSITPMSVNNTSNPFTSSSGNIFTGGPSQNNSNNNRQAGTTNGNIFNNGANNNTFAVSQSSNTSTQNTSKLSFPSNIIANPLNIPSAQQGHPFQANNNPSPPNTWAKPLNTNNTIQMSTNSSSAPNPFHSSPSKNVQQLGPTGNQIFPCQPINPFNSSSQPQNSFNTPPFSQSDGNQIGLPVQGTQDVERMMQNIQFKQPNKSKDPCSIYHSKLMMANLFYRIDRSQPTCPSSRQDLTNIKVKDYPNTDQILFMIKQMKDTSRNIRQMRQKLQDLNRKGDQMSESITKKIRKPKLANLHRSRLQQTVDQIQSDLLLIENELTYLVSPLLKAYESKIDVHFQNPNNCSLNVASSALSKVTILEKGISKITTQILRLFTDISQFEEQNALEAKQVILKLTECFEAVYVKFENLKERYELQKTEELNRPLKAQQTEQDDQFQPEGELTQKIMDVLSTRIQQIARLSAHTSIQPEQ